MSLTSMRQGAFEDAQRALLADYGVAAEQRRLQLADPPLSVHVLEAGPGEPVLFVHGSGTSAATWIPLLAHLRSRRALAVDLPGFGLSDPHDYRGRSLRRHAVAQLTSNRHRSWGLRSARCGDCAWRWRRRSA